MSKINNTISVNSSIKETLRKMNDLGEKCLLVVDKNKFIGTLSDGDIRKAILKNINFLEMLEDWNSTIQPEKIQSEIEGISMGLWPLKTYQKAKLFKKKFIKKKVKKELPLKNLFYGNQIKRKLQIIHLTFVII